MKKYLLLAISSLVLFGFSSAVNLNVTLPDSQGYQDLDNAMQGQSEISSDPFELVFLLQTINTYLWIAVGLVCMVVIVLAGIKLISGRGDEAIMKKATGTIVSAIIGIVVAIFSYLLVRVILNLF